MNGHILIHQHGRHHEQSRLISSALPMWDPDINVYTDVNMDINTDLPESIAPMLNQPRDHEWSYFNPSARPMPDTDVAIYTDVNADMATDLPEDSAPMMDSDLIVLDAVCDTAALLNSERDHEQSHGDLSARPILDADDIVVYSDVNDGIEADRPEKSAPRTNSDLILTELNNATLRKTLGGPTADNMLLCERDNWVVLSEDFSLKAAEMFIDPARSVLTHSHADVREKRILDVINMRIGYVSENDPETHDDDVDIAGLCRCPEIQEWEDPPILMNILQIYSGSDTPEQAELNVVISDCMVDLDDTDYDSDTDSIAELEFHTWDDAYVWEFRNMPEVFPPEIIQYSPAEGYGTSIAVRISEETRTCGICRL